MVVARGNVPIVIYYTIYKNKLLNANRLITVCMIISIYKIQ